MIIKAIEIERYSHQQYCGTLDYILEDLPGTLLWTVDATPLRIEVAFVQGSDENWDLLAQEHATLLSDKLILDIARRIGLPALVAPGLFPVV
ncbi:MAG: hypothetical protein CVV27_04785 [Candidatus Melainabacteria bacterium HGW-Melainabacteria-1]|nr:MAG: hypothetical protein CVV27_04785 [Candidatus Melainabacteria bacterium HGW-Melainabacteria-1]